MKEKYIKYANLLLKKCLNVKVGQPLIITAPVESIELIRIITQQALKLGVKDIYYDWYDDELKHEHLKYLTKNEIENNPFWNKKIYDEYAKKDAAFLMLVSDNPDLMQDINKDTLAHASKISRISRPLYKERQSINDVAWCIGSVSTIGWAEKVFNNDPNCVEKLWEKIFDICMINEENPIEAWNKKLNKSEERSKKLTKLNIKTLHYTNSLGTNLYVGLSKNTIWYGANETMPNGTPIICNIPTEEIFTTPNRLMTNGIVYSSKPLVYNGYIIEDFNIEFKEGKVINYDAKKGSDILETIINGDETSCYLGECALVDYDSPISNSNLIFYTTLFDENASCHLALGTGFPNTQENTKNKSKSELIEMGINVSDVHVDFMIGTSDLKIEAITYDNKEITIFENGNFIL